MTYLGAARKAKEAADHAEQAWRTASNEHEEDVARALQKLAEAVDQLSSSIHRDT